MAFCIPNSCASRFFPRHTDEIELEIGDPVYVQKEADDLWCEGINLRTGQQVHLSLQPTCLSFLDVHLLFSKVSFLMYVPQGIFPLAHVVDVDYNDFGQEGGTEERKERWPLLKPEQSLFKVLRVPTWPAPGTSWTSSAACSAATTRARRSLLRYHPSYNRLRVSHLFSLWL